MKKNIWGGVKRTTAHSRTHTLAFFQIGSVRNRIPQIASPCRYNIHQGISYYILFVPLMVPSLPYTSDGTQARTVYF
jgi:hypothetical protein